MTKYFTQDFTTLPSTRKVEEISTMLLRILGDSDALTDANIALVDQISELRGTLVSEPYEAYVNFPWRTASASFKTVEEANTWIESHHDFTPSREYYEYSWDITDRRTDSIIDSGMA